MNAEVECEVKVFGRGTWEDSITTKKIMYIKGGVGAVVVVGTGVELILTSCLYLVQEVQDNTIPFRGVKNIFFFCKR